MQALQGAFTIMPIIIAIFYAGELVWRDRERRLHEIVDATAAPDWAHLLPKILAITLATVPQLIRQGRSITQTLAIGREMISGEPETRLEYLALVNPGTFEPVSENHTGPALLIVAAQVGGVRLIDNHSFEI